MYLLNSVQSCCHRTAVEHCHCCLLFIFISCCCYDLSWCRLHLFSLIYLAPPPPLRRHLSTQHKHIQAPTQPPSHFPLPLIPPTTIHTRTVALHNPVTAEIKGAVLLQGCVQLSSLTHIPSTRQQCAVAVLLTNLAHR